MKHLDKQSVTLRSAQEQGQAMVEFVILLTVLMGMCAGMIFVHRLLTLQYWTQQEARLLAFDETWVAKAGKKLGFGVASEDIDNDARLHRSWSARVSDKNRNVEFNPSRPGMDDVFAWNWTIPDSSLSLDRHLGAPREESSLLQVAYRALEKIDLLPNAYARQDTRTRKHRRKNPDIQIRGNDSSPSGVYPQHPQRATAFENLLEQRNFGGKYCEAMRGVLRRHGVSLGSEFRQQDCADQSNRDFAATLAQEMDFVQLFEDYRYQMDEGLRTEDALKVSSERAVARGFYSFFDTVVKTAEVGAVPAIVLGNVEAAVSLVGDDYLRMLSDMRYVGSIVAMGSIGAAFADIGFRNASNRDVDAEREFERNLTDILHDDASDNYPVGPVNGFWMTIYNVIPIPDLAAVTGELFDGIAANVFAKESSGDEIFDEDDLIRNSSVLAEVTYNSANVRFNAANKRINTSPRTLRGSFYLLTQPWHISRRRMESSSQEFRDLGDQLDDMSAPTEEGILRRRAYGLYVFPSEPTDMLQPLTGVIPELDPVLQAFDFMDSIVGFVKDFVFNNPLNDVLDFISELPLIDLSAFKLPEFPAVRPQAYPRSTEIKNDRLAGSNRTFDDFLKEQKDNNPKPDPTFN